MTRPTFRIGILAGGGGTTFEAVHQATQTDTLHDTEIACVISNNGPTNPNALIWEKAQRLQVPIFHISNKTQTDCTIPVINGIPIIGTISYQSSERIVQLADDFGINMLVALGFMKKLIGPVLHDIPTANSHPGPLKATAGTHGTGVQEEIMKNGLNSSGPTLHWMDTVLDVSGLPRYDSGPEIGHEPVPVTAEMRIEWEHFGTVDILDTEVRRVEKLWIPTWIHVALKQLQ